MEPLTTGRAMAKARRAPDDGRATARDFPTPDNEARRVLALRGLHILDTVPDERFDRIVRLACGHFRVPVARISFVDVDRTWIKACIGLNVRQAPRSISICSHAIMTRDVLTVQDLAADPRFQDSPQVRGKPHFRFYAGAPVVLSGGHGVGTICLMDYAPRPEFSEEDDRFLAELAEIIVHELELHRQVAEVERDLVETKERLFNATVAKQRFMATISHELNTPLNAIVGFSDVIQERAAMLSDYSEIGTYNSHIRDAADRLCRLVNRILTYTAAETFELALEETQFAPAPLIRKCAELAAAAAAGPESQAQIGLEFAPDTPRAVLADETHFAQVLLELFQNAVRFAPPGAVATARAGATADGGFSLTVENQGVGLNQAMLDRVMEAFAQGDDSLARVHEGVGLGLPIARGIVELHGGRLFVRATEDGGAVAELTLPSCRSLA